MIENFKMIIDQHVQDAERKIFSTFNTSEIEEIRYLYCCKHGILHNLSIRTDEIDENHHRQFHHLIHQAKERICFFAEARTESDD